MSTTASESPDVVLIGAGIMSATLGTVRKELEPTLEVVMFETLHDCAQESSEAWNNAGTGHAANCELNYTPQRSDGSVDISRALQVNTEFDLSRELWSLGARGIRVEEPGDVRDAVAAALAHTGGPVVVDVVVDRYALALPSHVPAATVKGFTLSMAKQVLSGQMDEVIETVEHNVRLL
jgi:L-2-hydroxyglutarate oxidase LhgO